MVLQGLVSVMRTLKRDACDIVIVKGTIGNKACDNTQGRGRYKITVVRPTSNYVTVRPTSTKVVGAPSAYKSAVH